MRIHYGDTRR